MVVTRFAPSPTGYLHIGGLRTALFSYLWARRNQGKFLLRIEDTDQARNSQEATDAIIEAFGWVGMEHDGEVVYQSRRTELYKRYIAKLLDEGNAYYCYMTKEELDTLRQEQQAKGERPRYDGRYRNGTLPPRPDVEPVVRIKAPLEGTVVVDDGVKGTVTFNWTDATDDFIIARSDGSPTYNFVVAVDDALMGVNHVIRGDDHLSNTPKQLVVYKALGFEVPRFYHVPMIHNMQGKKLSKRDGAMDVMEYKHQGYLPEGLLNFLVRLGWSYGDQEIFSKEEMLSLFDPKDINKSASAYNPEKLLWLNSHYIKNAPNDRLIAELRGHDVHIHGHDRKEMLLDTLKEKSKTLAELAADIAELLQAPATYQEKEMEKLFPEGSSVLEGFTQMLETRKGTLHLPTDYQEAIKGFLAENDLKMPQLGKPLRLALLGKTQGPDLGDLLAILGNEEVRQRIGALLARLP